MNDRKPPARRDPHALPKAPNSVTIFGGGIAGLTAAHELAERGFQVQVWEPQVDDRFPERGCDVGGMARTQWAAVPWPLVQDLQNLAGHELPPDVEPPEAERVERCEPPATAPWRRARPIVHFPYRFYVRSGVPALLDGNDATVSPAALLERIEAASPARVVVTLERHGIAKLSPRERERRLRAYLAGEFSAEGAPSIDVAAARDIRISEDRRTFWFTARGIPIELTLHDSLNVDRGRLTIECLNDQGEHVGEPLVLRVRFRPGQLTATLPPSECLPMLLDLFDACPEIDTWYVEAATPIGGMSREEFQRRADLVRLAFTEELAKLGLEGASPVKYDARGRYHYSSIERRSGRGPVCLIIVPIAARPYPPHEDVPEDIEVSIGFRPRVRWLPGEHGYRFFPSFYHHVFDTMRRTPLLELEEKSELAQAQERASGIRVPETRQYVETGRTVFDNLVPTSSHVLAFADRQRSSPQLSRYRLRSLEELRSYVRLIFGEESGGLGLAPRDVARLLLKLLEFATACEARRETYSEVSWWEFIEGDSYGEAARELLSRWPEALVAMDATECDARTQAIAFWQLILDQIRPSGYRDGTLRGPTSEAWLNPWRRYLEAQGVEFVHGELLGFELHDDGTVWPVVDCFDLRYPCTVVDEGDGVRMRRSPELRPGYFVLATPTHVTRELAERFAELGLSHTDLDRARGLGADPPPAVDLARARPEGDLRHFAGIQYYFAEDVYWVDGHVYYPDSPWQLTSVSQARFWQHKMDWEHGYRGVLSVIIGTWDAEGYNGKRAWECTEAEIALEVWEQIEQSLRARGSRADRHPVGFVRRTPTGPLPKPLCFHLDQNLERTSTGYTNASPFFIARPGRFGERPGDLDGYAVEHGIVLAGHHMKTYTRLPCMEAANESGRHAVNAILRHLIENGARNVAYHGTFCDIWNPEDRELDDLSFFQELDERLFERGRGHVFEILAIDSLLENVLRGGPRDPLDPLKLLERLRRLIRPSGELGPSIEGGTDG